MTNPNYSTNHAQNPELVSLKNNVTRTRGEFAQVVALPPRSEGAVAYATNRVLSQAPERDEHYDEVEGRYFDAVVEYIYTKHQKDEHDSNEHSTGSLADNEKIVGDLIAEFNDNAGESINDRYDDMYEQNKGNRRLRKVLAKVAVAGGSIGTGVTLVAMHPGATTGLIAAGTTTAAAFSTKVYEPNPNTNRVLLDQNDIESGTEQLEKRVVKQMERLGFDGDIASPVEVVRRASRWLKANGESTLKDRRQNALGYGAPLAYQEAASGAISTLLSEISRESTDPNDPETFYGDMNKLRVRTAADLVWSELDLARDEAMRTTRRGSIEAWKQHKFLPTRALGRAAFWLVGVGAGAAIFGVAGSAHHQHDMNHHDKQQTSVPYGTSSNPNVQPSGTVPTSDLPNQVNPSSSRN